MSRCTAVSAVTKRPCPYEAVSHFALCYTHQKVREKLLKENEPYVRDQGNAAGVIGKTTRMPGEPRRRRVRTVREPWRDRAKEEREIAGVNVIGDLD